VKSATGGAMIAFRSRALSPVQARPTPGPLSRARGPSTSSPKDIPAICMCWWMVVLS